MLATIMKWLFGTAMGRGVLMGGSIAIGIALGWWAFSSHYDDIGYKRGKAECDAAVAAANVTTVKEQNERDDRSLGVGKKATETAADAVNKIDNRTNNTEEKLDVIYRDRVKTVPIAFDSCVHPVDPRVQQTISSAVDKANSAAR